MRPYNPHPVRQLTDPPLPAGEGRHWTMPRKRKSGWKYTPTAEHRARLLENLAMARRRKQRRSRRSKSRREAALANLEKARAVLRERGWPHSEKQRAAARENIKKAQAAIHERGLPTTEARRAAIMANLAKAHARLRELKYPRNEKQKAAARANLAKAHEESRKPESYDRYHRHKLKHGLYADLYDKLLGQLADVIAERRRKKG